MIFFFYFCRNLWPVHAKINSFAKHCKHYTTHSTYPFMHFTLRISYTNKLIKTNNIYFCIGYMLEIWHISIMLFLCKVAVWNSIQYKHKTVHEAVYCGITCTCFCISCNSSWSFAQLNQRFYSISVFTSSHDSGKQEDLK